MAVVNNNIPAVLIIVAKTINNRGIKGMLGNSDISTEKNVNKSKHGVAIQNRNAVI